MGAGVGIDRDGGCRIGDLFAAADAVRDELKSIGIELMDTPAGTVWEKVLDA